jgi:DnaJ-class molecular chaperone
MDYYAVLELDDTAEAPDIKKAYRRLCVQRHPDKSKSSNSTKDFLPVREAKLTALLFIFS